MAFGERFASMGAAGMVTRAGLAWILITPAIAAAKILWSGTAALAVGIVGVGVYPVFAVRYVRRHQPHPEN